MQDAIVMWRETKMVVLTALIAATYAAVMIPFKGFAPIPGFAEVRPGAVVPIIFSLMFGPAAAWGAALGNFIADIGGTFGPGSAFGFVGNFFLAYIPYRVWGRMGICPSGAEPTMRSRRQIAEFVIAAALASCACATFIGWGLDILGLVPFSAFANWVFLQNIVVSVVIGPPLLAALYPRVKKWGLLFRDIMSSSEAAGRHRWLLVLLLAVAVGSAYLIGNAFYFGAAKPIAGKLGLALGLAPSIGLMVLAVALL